jgi:Protein of unknown function (DUF1559)
MFDWAASMTRRCFLCATGGLLANGWPGARRSLERSAQNLRSLVIAMHAYREAHRTFPPPALCDEAGTPLLSWRVALLPYLGEQELYSRSQLREPWDSPRNWTLLERMPRVYALAGATPAEAGHTIYRVFVGAGAVFEDSRGISLAELPDGMGTMAMIVEADESVPWTRPAEIPYASCAPVRGVGTRFRDGFLVAYCDGDVRLIRNDFDEVRMRLAIGRDDGYGFPRAPNQP